ncbi:MAG: hypothetical protein L0170_17750 [Acidobacteria bacterium]|nr:hypothetical protein [Acidobacteriota bacterium]
MAKQADVDVDELVRRIDKQFQEARRNFRCWAYGTTRRPTVKKQAGVTPGVKAAVDRLAGEIVTRRLATVQAPAMAMERAVLRPAADLVPMLLQEIGQDLGASDDQVFDSALARAKRTIFQDVAAGIR